MTKPRRAEALRGLARALTADLVGGPVDLAQAIANLGIAGGGYVGHKLGLLDQPPELLQGSVGTSDWWAKGTPLEDKGSAAYSAGRMTGSILPMLGSIAKAIPRQRHGQVNSVLVPEEWLKKYNIPDEYQGMPLGRLDAREPGQRLVALPRKSPIDDRLTDTLNRATGSKVPVGDLLPELQGTPLENLAVSRLTGARQGVLGSFDQRTGHMEVVTEQPPLGVLNTLHHELTHAAQDKGLAAARGSNQVVFQHPQLFMPYMDGAGRLRQHTNPAVARIGDAADARLRFSLDNPWRYGYRNNTGEIFADVAGQTAGTVAPSSGTLEAIYRSVSAGRDPHFEMAVRGGGKALVSQNKLIRGDVVIARDPANNTALVTTRDGTFIGWLEPSELGAAAQKK